MLRYFPVFFKNYLCDGLLANGQHRISQVAKLKKSTLKAIFTTMIMKLIQTLILLLFSLYGIQVAGQGGQPIAMGAAHVQIMEAEGPNAPKDVKASDGVYDKFVLVLWENSENASSYKVFRSTDPKKSPLQEVSRSWQKSNWLCDYTALPGVKYHYAVVASNGKIVSPTSQFDQGHIRTTPIANEEEELSLTEAYAAPHLVYLLASGMKASQKSLRAGETFEVEANLQNIFDQATSRTEVRIFLSKNAQLDWDDQLLGRRNLSSVLPNAALVLKESLTLPTDALPGEYHLIIVCSAESEILGSKTDSTVIQIIR